MSDYNLKSGSVWMHLKVFLKLKKPLKLSLLGKYIKKIQKKKQKTQKNHWTGLKIRVFSNHGYR